MRLPTIATSAALLTALTLVASPALAGQHGGSGHHGGGSAPQSHASSQPRAQAAPAARPQAQAQAPVNRSQSFARNNNAFVGNAAPRAAAGPRYSGNYAGNPGNNHYASNNGGHYASNYNSHYAPNYGAHYASGYHGGAYYAPHYGYGYGHGYYAPRYYGPGYAFRPWFSIGFGVYAGYPVPYAFDYGYPVPVYGYAQPQSVIVNPGQSANNYGGISFEVTPYEAEVYVDGNFAGHVADFNGGKQPMTLAAGTHHVEIVANGYQTLSFDANVQPGQIIPYRGDLQQ